ncbi:MAG: general secretion pathway protein GspB [Pseudomonadota bacterium]
MSLILDALKKSDAERSRHRAPEAAAALRPVGESNASRWWILVAVLLVINTIAVLWLVTRPESTAAIVPAPTQLVEPRVTAADPQPTTAAPATEISPPVASRTSKVERLSEQVAKQDTASEIGRSIEPIDEGRGPASTAAPASTPQRLVEYPTYATYGLETGKNFGTLAVSLHVYDADPGRRFAFVDGQRVTEGARVTSNLSLVEITPEGVVFQDGRNRFIVRVD